MKTIYQFITFSFIGALTAVLHLLFVFFCTDVLGLNYLASSMFSYACAIVFNFCMQRKFLFHDASPDTRSSQFTRFIVVSGACFVLNSVFMYTLVSVFSVWYILAQAVTIMTLTLLTFITYRTYVFR
jgi:putative flippase GtrA